MKTGAASSEKAFYEARLTAYDAQLTLHEAALRTIKRSLFRLHVFCKKWGANFCFLYLVLTRENSNLFSANRNNCKTFPLRLFT